LYVSFVRGLDSNAFNDLNDFNAFSAFNEAS